jgi:hypothetical protein
MHTKGPFHGKQSGCSVKLIIHLHIVPRLKCVMLYYPLLEGPERVVVKEIDGVVDLATSYGLDGLRFESWKEKRLFFFLNCPDRIWGTLNLIFNGHRVSFSRVKRSGRKVEHILSHSAEIKNEWSYSSAPFYTFME